MRGNPVKSPLCWWLLFSGWGLLLWHLSSRSHLPGPEGIPHLDKLVHAGYFLGGGVIAFVALRLSFGPQAKRWPLWVVLALSSYGAMDEWHQLSTPGRSGADPWDWLADTVGAALGVWIGKKGMEALAKPASAAS